MANSTLALGSSLNLKRINKSVNSLGESVRNAQSSATGISKSLVDSNRTKRKSLALTSSLFRRRREANLRREREDIIEAGSVSGAVRRTGKVAMNSTKGFLGRILDFTGTVLVGWALLNLPQIINLADGLVKRMQNYFNVLQEFTSGVYTNITGFIGSLGETITSLTGFNFDSVKDLFDKTLIKMRDSFNIIENGAINIINKLIDIDSIKKLVEYFGYKIEDFTGLNIPGLGQDERPPGAGGSGGAGRYGVILDLVAKAEGGYDSVNYGRGPGKIPGLSGMTIREAYNASERYRAKYGGTGAMGAYQLVDDPLGRATRAGLNVDKDLFSPKNQDKIAVYLIEKERGITPDLIKNNPNKAALRLAQLFAGIPVLSSAYSSYAGRIVRRGESFYQGFGGNRATVSAEKVEKAFKQFASAPEPTKPTPPSKQPKVGSTINYTPQELEIIRKANPGMNISGVVPDRKGVYASSSIASAATTNLLIINRTVTKSKPSVVPQSQQRENNFNIAKLNNNTFEHRQLTYLT